MADVPNKMTHNTVESVGILSAKSTKTGGMPAQHNIARLKNSFPASPLYKNYNSTKVAGLKNKILMNDVTPSDQGDAQSYWGYPQIDASEESPSGVDLSYAGAPSLTNDTVLEPEGEHPIVIPFFPILAPDILYFSDEQKGELDKERLLSIFVPPFTPFSGEGTLLDPSTTSTDIKGQSLGMGNVSID